MLRTIADFISHFGYCWSMSKTNSEERKARDAAFAELLDSLNPGSALRRQMIAARVRAGLSQQELAKRMGTAQSTIARLERGGRSPNISTLRKFAEATDSRLVMRLDATELQIPSPATSAQA
jgi:ribosome-binding protein aMBF1 (putative translation factor)